MDNWMGTADWSAVKRIGCLISSGLLTDAVATGAWGDSEVLVVEVCDSSVSRVGRGGAGGAELLEGLTGGTRPSSSAASGSAVDLLSGQFGGAGSSDGFDSPSTTGPGGTVSSVAVSGVSLGTVAGCVTAGSSSCFAVTTGSGVGSGTVSLGDCPAAALPGIVLSEDLGNGTTLGCSGGMILVVAGWEPEAIRRTCRNGLVVSAGC